MSSLVDTFRTMLRRNPTLPPAVLRGAYEATCTQAPAAQDYSINACREELAHRDDVPVDLLVTLARDPRPETRAEALVSPRIPAQVAQDAARSETDQLVLRRFAYRCHDGQALRILAQRRLPAKGRVRTLIALAGNPALPGDVKAHLLLRLDDVLPTDTTEIADRNDSLRCDADTAVDMLLQDNPLLGAQIADAARSMRARQSAALHATTLTGAQWDRLLAQIVFEPLAAAAEPQLPLDVGNRAAKLLGNAAALPTAHRQALITALAGRDWRATTCAGTLRKHLTAPAVNHADADRQRLTDAAALAAQVAAMTDPDELAATASRADVDQAVARALVANPHLPTGTAVKVAQEHLRFDEVFVAGCRPGDDEFMRRYAKSHVDVLKHLSNPSTVIRQILELRDTSFSFSGVAEWARNAKALPMLSADDRLALRWPTAHRVTGVDEGFDRWMLDLLTPVLEQPGGATMLARIGATFAGTVGDLVGLLTGTLAPPLQDTVVQYPPAA